MPLAKLYQSARRAAGAHATLAPALEGFSPTQEFPEIEEAQTLLAALGETAEVKNAAVARQRRLKLQTTYGQALLWSKGFGADETKAAFTRAQELAQGVDNGAERFTIYYAQWANSFMRGDFGAASDVAESLLREAQSEEWQLEASSAQRMAGYTRLRQGDFIGAREHLKEALKIYNARSQLDTMLSLDLEPGLAAMVYLALAKWVLGDITQATHQMDEAVSWSLDAGHVPTLANSLTQKAELEVLSGNTEAAFRAAEAAFAVSREHEFGHYLPIATVYLGWARARLGQTKAGLEELRKGLAAHTGNGNKAWVPIFQALLADVEVEHNAEEALNKVDQALTLANETGEHWTDAFLYRIRGEILLKRDPANPAPAEEAFLTAITVAREQNARSFELRAALSLAKLYQSTGRPAESYAVLAPALESFSPTPEFPDIAEAQSLLLATAS